MKRIALLMALMSSGVAYGQKALTHYFPAGQNNASVLVENYVKPMGEDLGALGNNGWYNTAATHKRFGFDISLTMNAIFLPSDHKYSTPPSLTGTSFNGTVTPSGTIDRVPTVYGNEKEYPSFLNNAAASSNKLIPFVGPDGVDPQKTYGVNAAVLPTLQAGIGLFANTDLRVRFTPQTKIGDFKAGSFGFAVMHDIKQHIGGLKDLPFSMSVLVGYTQVDGKVDLSGAYGQSATNSSGAGQEGKTSSASTTAQLLISKSLAIITFYGGLGYNTSTTKFDINGTYYVDQAYNNPAPTVPLPNPFTLTNPYHYSFKSSGFKATLGARFKLGPFFLNGDYSFYGSQNLLSVGAGFTFR
jgi:hypothetical protein